MAIPAGQLVNPLYVDPVSVVNDSSTAIPAYGIMEFSGSASVFVKGRPVFKVRQPSTDYKRSYLINGPTAIGTSSSDNKYGTAYFACNTPVWALWKSGDTTPAVGAIYGPRASEFTMQSGSYGFTVVGVAETSPIRRVLIVQKFPDTIFVQLNGDLTSGGNVGADVLTYGSSAADSGQDVTVYDAMGYILSGRKLVADNKCTVVPVGTKWALIQGPCTVGV